MNSSDTQVLTLYNVTEEEGGEYICKVSNYIGAANQSAWLTVIKPQAQGNPSTGAQRGHIRCGKQFKGHGDRERDKKKNETG